MTSRFVVYALVATLTVGAFAFAADALVVSDQEQLEALADDLTKGAATTDAVLGWVDLSRENVQISGEGGVERFGESEDVALGERVATLLDPVTSGSVEVVQRSARASGDRGTVAVRLRVDGQIHDVTARLARSGQGWLLTDLRVR
jgi:hypothetical protein